MIRGVNKYIVESVEVQSVMFDKDKYSVKDAKRWLKKHNFKNDDVDVKKTVIKFRQKNPKKYKDFFVKEIKSGIKFIFGK